MIRECSCGSDPAQNPARPRAEPLLALQGVTKRFGSLVALSDASLDIMPGEVHCILGENGAGKSTLCNVIFGVQAPDDGTMRYLGKPYRPSGPADALASGIAMVHQHFSLVHDMTVVDNVILGQERGIVNTKAWAERIEKLGERLTASRSIPSPKSTTSRSASDSASRSSSA